MKIAIIDIGSNSVRLMLWADGKTLYKTMSTTRLGEGLNFSPYLSEKACERTAQAIAEFYRRAKEEGAREVHAFATAAVRSSKNPELFTDKVKALCGLTVDILSGEEEAQAGLSGALGNSDGGIIDVGGASTEVTLRKGGKIVYSHSANIGTVRILDAAGRDLKKIDEFVAEKIKVYGKADFSDCNMYAVGGTASRLAVIKHNLKTYQPSVIHGTVLTREEVRAYAGKLTAMTVEEIQATTIIKKSADVIGGGAALLAAVMEYFNIQKITVSESDNLEGYVISKLNI